MTNLIRTRRHLYLIFKEGVNNLVKHSQCTNAEISIQQQGNDLTLTIQDNGKGFDPNAGYESHGLRITKQRATDIGATLEVKTTPGSGTTTHLRLPLR